MNYKGIIEGIAIGRAYIHEEKKLNIEKTLVYSSNEELEKFKDALNKSMKDIELTYKKTLVEVGEEEAEIFKAHRMILADPEFIGRVIQMVGEERVNSEWAVKEIINDYINIFEKMEDEYLRARILDLKDVSKRLIKNILKLDKDEGLKFGEETIVIGKDLSPSDTISMDREMLAGIITEKGSMTSHTAIIAKSLGIPALIGYEDIRGRVRNGDLIILDGYEGKLIIKPSRLEVEEYKKRLLETKEYRKRLKSRPYSKTISKDGHRVLIAGNINSPQDLEEALENGAEAIGLFRTEFLYMNRDNPPSEEEQYSIYKDLALRLGSKPLVIRSFDIGGDKDIGYLDLEEEANPFLGLRGIRLALAHKELLKEQIRAILRAGIHGNLKLMFPMISSIEEVREARSIVEEAKEELATQNLKFDQELEVGIMVETPAVALQSYAFAKEVDFFSIGSNDLIQYSLAADRCNNQVNYLNNHYDPSIVKLIKMIIDGGHKAGIKVAMCGEAASDEKFVGLLLSLGLDEFSMSGSLIPQIKDKISKIDKANIDLHLDKILDLVSAQEVENYIDEKIK